MAKTLAEVVQDKLDAGTLPRDEPIKLWAGSGSGNTCAACEHPILPSQTEYEVEYYDERPAILLHVGCHTTWVEERSSEP